MRERRRIHAPSHKVKAFVRDAARRAGKTFTPKGLAGFMDMLWDLQVLAEIGILEAPGSDVFKAAREVVASSFRDPGARRAAESKLDVLASTPKRPSRRVVEELHEAFPKVRASRDRKTLNFGRGALKKDYDDAVLALWTVVEAGVSDLLNSLPDRIDEDAVFKGPRRPGAFGPGLRRLRRRRRSRRRSRSRRSRSPRSRRRSRGRRRRSRSRRSRSRRSRRSRSRRSRRRSPRSRRRRSSRKRRFSRHRTLDETVDTLRRRYRA